MVRTLLGGSHSCPVHPPSLIMPHRLQIPTPPCTPMTTQRGASEDIRDTWREATGYGNYSPLKLGREAVEGSAFMYLLRSDVVAR